MSGLTRTDESRLAALRKRAAAAEERGTSRPELRWAPSTTAPAPGRAPLVTTDQSPLTEAEELQLSLLEERYEAFLQEGIRKLRSTGSPPSRARPSHQAHSDPSVKQGGGSWSVLSKLVGPHVAQRIRTSITGKDAPESDEPQRSCVKHHWTWLTENFVVGAVPYAVINVGAVPYSSMASDHSGHLLGLKDQCIHRNCRIALVVSLMELDELERDGLEYAGYAQPRDWEEMMSVTTFVHVPMPRDMHLRDRTSEAAATTVAAQQQEEEEEEAASDEEPRTSRGGAIATPSYPLVYVQMRDAFRAIAAVTSGATSAAVFVHCKSGKYRSWAFTMCFLVATRGLTYDEAKDLLRLSRPVFVTTPELELFVCQFVQWFSSEGHLLPPSADAATRGDPAAEDVPAALMSPSPPMSGGSRTLSKSSSAEALADHQRSPELAANGDSVALHGAAMRPPAYDYVLRLALRLSDEDRIRLVAALCASADGV